MLIHKTYRLLAIIAILLLTLPSHAMNRVILDEEEVNEVNDLGVEKADDVNKDEEMTRLTRLPVSPRLTWLTR